MRVQAVVTLVDIRDRQRALLALLNIQLAFAQVGAKAEACLRRGEEVSQLLRQVRDGTQLAL